jgi:hypothetical protein
MWFRLLGGDPPARTLSKDPQAISLWLADFPSLTHALPGHPRPAAGESLGSRFNFSTCGEFLARARGSAGAGRAGRSPARESAAPRSAPSGSAGRLPHIKLAHLGGAAASARSDPHHGPCSRPRAAAVALAATDDEGCAGLRHPGDHRYPAPSGSPRPARFRPLSPLSPGLCRAPRGLALYFALSAEAPLL